MRVAVHAKSAAPVPCRPPLLDRAEAVAVLHELRHRTNRRLLEACQEFQDLVFEMEWRLGERQALGDRRRWLERDLRRTRSLRSHFNVASHRRRGVQPRARAWERQDRQLRSALKKVKAQLAEAEAVIGQRNREGAALEQEIIGLQDRCARIDRGLRRVRRPRAVGSDSAEATAGAMARLVIELSAEPGVGDLANLVLAARFVDDRLNG